MLLVGYRQYRELQEGRGYIRRYAPSAVRLLAVLCFPVGNSNVQEAATFTPGLASFLGFICNIIVIARSSK